MSSISAPAVGALPVLVDDEQMSDTVPASISDGSEKNGFRLASALADRQ